MTQFLQFFSIQNVAFTIWNYPVSWLELVGVIFNFWSVILATRNRIGTWPVGLVGVALFFLLFYQGRFYADVFEQVYYLFVSLYGWWNWSRVALEKQIDLQQLEPTGTGSTLVSSTAPVSTTDVSIIWSGMRSIGTVLAVSLVLSLVAGWATSNLHIWQPALFPKAAAYPYVDAATTVMSFTATWLMARKRLECWVYWLAIDVVGVWLYYVQGFVFVAMLFVALLFLAASGLLHWRSLAVAAASADRAVRAAP